MQGVCFARRVFAVLLLHTHACLLGTRTDSRGSGSVLGVCWKEELELGCCVVLCCVVLGVVLHKLF